MQLEPDQRLELKRFVKQLLTHSNFLWFSVMNLIQVSEPNKKLQILLSVLYVNRLAAVGR